MLEDFRVNFMIIGAQKSGTSSLAEQLATHREICFCKEKEPAYFNTVSDWQSRLEEYHRLYSPSANQICGEASTSYTFIPEYQETHSRLFAYNSNLKLIYIMRQPLERIRSHYAHRVAHGRVHDPPDVSIFSDPTYVKRTCYWLQIQPYLELFGPDNVLLLIFEEYIRDQMKTLRQIASFLEISASNFGQIDTSAKNQSNPKHKPKFSIDLQQKLCRLLEEDVEKIEQSMGRRIELWRN
jgi:hypothetical protein